MASLFISYSRIDVSSAEKVVQALTLQKLDTWVDWKSIPKGEDWWNEIAKGIEESDIFLFLISPDSVKSEVCNREIAHAVLNNKRVIPVVIRDAATQNFLNEISRKEITRRNWIFCRDGRDDFASAIQETLTIIDTDYDWVKYHTRLLVESSQWDRNDRERSFLLRGKELEEAERQLVANSSKEPPPTDLQREYVLRSRQASNRQQRITLAIAIAGIIALAGLATFGFLQAGLATTNARKEQAASTLASNNARTAEANAATASANAAEAKRQSTIALSRQLTAKSQTELLANHDRRLSLLFAIEAIRLAREANGSQNLASEQALRDALSQTGGKVIINPIDEPVYIARSGALRTNVPKALSPVGNWLAIDYQDRSIHIWDLVHPQNNPQVLRPSGKGLPDKLVFSPNGRFLFLIDIDGLLEFWDTEHLTEASRSLSIKVEPEPWFLGFPLVFSANDRWLSITVGGEVLLFDLLEPDAQPLRIKGEEGEFTAPPVAVSAEGDHLMLFNSKFQADQLWDLKRPEQKPVTLAEGPSSCLTGLFSPDGAWFAADCRGIVRLWSVLQPSKPDMERIPWRGDFYTLGNISPDGTKLAVASGHDSIYVRDITPAGTEFSLSLYSRTGSVSGFQFSRDNRWLACIDAEGNVLVWDLAPKTRSFPMTLSGLGGFNAPVELMAFTPDNMHLITVSDDGVTRSWDLSNPFSDTLGIPGANVNDFSFSPDERWLAVNGYSSALFDLQKFGRGPVPLSGVTNSLFFGSNPDQLVAVSNEAGKILTWQAQSLAQGNLKPNSRILPGRMVGSVAAHRWLFSQLKDATLQAWDLFDPSAKPIFLPRNRIVEYEIAFTSDRHRLATRGEDKTVQIWNLDTMASPPIAVQGVKAPSDLQLSPRGNWLALIDEGKIKVWDLRQSAQQPLYAIEPDERGSWIVEGPDAFQFSADEHWLAMNESVGLKVLDLQTPGAQPVTIPGLAEAIDKIALSPDGRWLAGSSFIPDLGYEVRLWNLEDLAADPIVLHRQKDLISSLAFSPNARWLAVAFSLNAYHTVEVWRLDVDELIELACESLGSNLSRRQWAENFPSDIQYRKTCPKRPEGKDKQLVIPAG